VVVIVTAMFGIVMIDMLFHVAVAFGIMMIDVLFNYPFAGMVITIPTVISIPVPSIIPVPIPIFPAMLIAVPVWVPLAFVPSVVMPWRCFIIVLVTLVVPMPSIASVSISPCVAAQCQGESYQCYADDHEFAYHVDLLAFGLRS
jgi:hypothetical protein